MEDTTDIQNIVIKEHAPIDYRELRFGNTLLMLSVLNNKTRSIIKLLELGANPNLRAHDDSSPFLQALFSLDSTSLEALIKYGADVNSVQNDTTLNQFGKKKNYHTTALGIACFYGKLKTVKILIENGAKVNTDNENSSISAALLTDHLDVVKYLMIEKKIPITEYVAIRERGTPNEKKLSMRDILTEADFTGYPEKKKLRLELLEYLKSIGK